MALLERGESLNRLTELFLATKDGHGRLALVTGEAGIGKTAVVEAFCATWRDRADVLWGMCDAVVPPRPFAPLIDIADRMGASLRGALDAADRDAVFEAVLARLRGSTPLQRILVIEDLHWSDEATLDLLRVVGRRLRGIPVLVIGTYRSDDVARDHALRLALGDIPAASITQITLSPLSRAGVAVLAAESGIDADELYRATGGNPFFVTEAASSGLDEVPTTVRDAVAARAARLSNSARVVLAAASVLGHRFDGTLVRRLAHRGAAAVRECEMSGIIRWDGTALRFRHELAQRAIRDQIDPADRIVLHRRALDLLSEERATEPGELAHHAIAANDAQQVLRWAPAAARRAASLGAHRQAADHYASARPFVAAPDLQTRAELLEGEARERVIIDEVEVALQAQEDALACWRELRDVRREGDALRALSQMLWFGGAADRAADAAERAVDTLRALPPGPELARAYAAVAQRSMTSGRDEAAIEWGERALELATALDEEPVAVHALATIGVVQISAGNEVGWTTLEDSFRRAVAARLHEDAIRALINLLEAARDRRRYGLADRYRDLAMRHLAEHDLGFDLLRRRLVSDLAEVSLERGHWHEAAELAELLLSETGTARRIRVSALTTLGRLRARRGDRDAWALLDEALALAGPEADAEALIPLHTARVEAASLTDDATRAGDEARMGLALVADLERDPWQGGELGFWAWHAGAVDGLPADAAQPYALHVAGRHRDAAAAWEAIGCPYQAALALADSHDEIDQRRALETFIALGARPMARRMTNRLHARGARGIRRGPRSVTRTNPGQLTPREMQVLSLVAEGLRNGEIAQRMVVSVKTIDHHVSSILRKLNVPTRAAAAVEAARLGLKDGQPPPAI